MENAMNCSSLPDNQTADFIERFFPFTYNQILENDSGCYDFVNHEYVIWHRSLAEALPLSVQQYGYDSIPNLYTILDTAWTAQEFPGPQNSHSWETRGAGR